MASSSADLARRPRVLMATFHDWDAPLPLGSHHLARGFVDAGWDVARVASAISPIQLLRDPAEFRHRLSRYQWRGERHLGGHLWTYTPVGLLTPCNAPLLRGATVHRTWQRLTIPNLIRDRWVARVLRRSTCSRRQRGPGLLGRCDPAWRVRSSGSATCMTGFAGFTAAMTRTWRPTLPGGVDVVAYSAWGLEPHPVCAACTRRLLHFPNGVDLAHFTDADRTPPADLASIPRPIAIYVGALDDLVRLRGRGRDG